MKRTQQLASRPPRRPTSFDGILVVDKPQGMTSHDVVARLRRLCGTRSVGHGGTLDPMATGVLICGIGKGTKLLTYVSGSDKSYSATIRLGISTTTDDAEGEIVSAAGAWYLNAETDIPSFCAQSQNLESDTLVTQVTSGSLLREVADLTGDINQVPTSVSAIKVNGKRAYDLVREGEEVELKARPVKVSEFRIIELANAEVNDVPVIDLTVEVTVSSGTYVRALARDLGAALGVGGHLTMLRRTRIGQVELTMAQSLESLELQADQANSDGYGLLTMPLGEAAALFLATRQVSDDEAQDLSKGKFIEISDTDSITAALTEDNQLVAIIEPYNQTKAKPKVVFPWEQ